jgi:hypothetical protein
MENQIKENIKIKTFKRKLTNNRAGWYAHVL